MVLSREEQFLVDKRLAVGHLVGIDCLYEVLFCQLKILSEAFDILSRLERHLSSYTDGPCAHLAGAIIDLAKPHSCLLLMLNTVYPDTQVDIELVSRQEHPAKLAHELQRRQYIVNVLFCLEIIKVQAREAHTEKLMALV